MSQISALRLLSHRRFLEQPGGPFLGGANNFVLLISVFDTAQESRLLIAHGYGQLPAAGLHDLFGQSAFKLLIKIAD